MSHVYQYWLPHQFLEEKQSHFNGESAAEIQISFHGDSIAFYKNCTLINLNCWRLQIWKGIQFTNQWRWRLKQARVTLLIPSHSEGDRTMFTWTSPLFMDKLWNVTFHAICCETKSKNNLCLHDGDNPHGNFDPWKNELQLVVSTRDYGVSMSGWF